MFYRNSLLLLSLVWVLGALNPAQAQFMTNIKLNKDNYMTYEPVEATITISNRSGGDVVMGGPNGLSWLTFEVVNPNGSPVPSIGLRSEEALVFKSGDTLSRKVLISNSYPFSEYGNYVISASVYHPPSQQYYGSNKVRASFSDAKPFWEQSFGVPVGLPGAGQIRRYAISTMRDLDRTYLYVRLIEEQTKLKLATFCLGTCVMVADPQISVDKANKLHVLFMAAPHIYAHVTVDTSGKIVKRHYYKEIETNRPQLYVQADQEIGVQGGDVYDPTAAADPKPKGRSVGEKPPGL
jgi:hypothetical protein